MGKLDEIFQIIRSVQVDIRFVLLPGRVLADIDLPVPAEFSAPLKELHVLRVGDLVQHDVLYRGEKDLRLFKRTGDVGKAGAALGPVPELKKAQGNNSGEHDLQRRCKRLHPGFIYDSFHFRSCQSICSIL